MVRSIKPIKIDEKELRASIYKDSFYEFLRYFWDTVITEEYKDNWHIQVLCYELQRIVKRYEADLPKEDLLINISPGTTKSTICSIMFPVWLWTRLGSYKTICGSHTYTLALELSRKSRLIVKSDKFKAIFPDLKIIDDQDTKGYFVNSQGGFRMATSTLSSIIGWHANFLIVDDPLDPLSANKLTGTDLNKANEWLFETLITRKIDKKKVPMILIMQRLIKGDPSDEILERASRRCDNVRHIRLPAELKEAPKVKPARLKRFYKDGLMDVERLSESVLRGYEVDLGPCAYAAQFLQAIVMRSGGMFQVERLKIDVPSYKIIKKVRFWDKAGTESKTASYTVGLLLGLDENNRFWVLDIIRDRWDTGKREEVIKSIASLDGKNVIIGIEQEPGSGGLESAQNTVRNLAGYRVRVVRPTGSKEIRADPVSIQVNMGNVSMIEALWNKAFIDELRVFPRTKMKDQVDTLSGAFTVITAKRKAGVIQSKKRRRKDERQER